MQLCDVIAELHVINYALEVWLARVFPFRISAASAVRTLGHETYCAHCELG